MPRYNMKDYQQPGFYSPSAPPLKLEEEEEEKDEEQMSEDEKSDGSSSVEDTDPEDLEFFLTYLLKNISRLETIIDKLHNMAKLMKANIRNGEEEDDD
jgi:hypothetical protein